MKWASADIDLEDVDCIKLKALKSSLQVAGDSSNKYQANLIFKNTLIFIEEEVICAGNTLDTLRIWEANWLNIPWQFSGKYRNAKGLTNLIPPSFPAQEKAINITESFYTFLVRM